MPFEACTNGGKSLPQGFELTELEGIPLWARSNGNNRNGADESHIPADLNPEELAERIAVIADMCGVSDEEAQRMALAELNATQPERIFDNEGNEYFF